VTANLQDQSGRREARPRVGNAEKVAPGLETRKAHIRVPIPGKLSGQTLPAFGPTIGQHLAATDSRHPAAKPVPTLPHELARLVSAFHWRTPLKAGRCISVGRR
jgi:hypothetical protein